MIARYRLLKWNIFVYPQCVEKPILVNYFYKCENDTFRILQAKYFCLCRKNRIRSFRISKRNPHSSRMCQYSYAKCSATYRLEHVHLLFCVVVMHRPRTYTVWRMLLCPSCLCSSDNSCNLTFCLKCVHIFKGPNQIIHATFSVIFFGFVAVYTSQFLVMI